MDNDQPRQPHNLQGLLRFAMEATRSEDAPNESLFAEMDPERRQFLEEALRNLTVDVVEELERAVKTIMDEESSEPEMLESFEIISDYVQEIDSANDFYKVGGFCVLDKGIASPHSRVKSATLRLLRDLAQNNPFCQEKLLEQNILPKLTELLSNESPDQVSCDALSAISACVRGYEPGLKSFLDIGGLECMLGCVADDSKLKLQIRAAFLIYTITSEYDYLIAKLIELNAIERLAPHIRFSREEAEDQQQQKLENILSALGQLTNNPRGVSVAAELNLSEKLEAISKEIRGQEEFQEIYDFSQLILTRIDNSQNKEDRADR